MQRRLRRARGRECASGLREAPFSRETRRETTLHDTERTLYHERERADRDRSFEKLRRVIFSEAVDDVLTEPTAADECGERGASHHLDGGRAHAGENDGKGERPLYAPPLLRTAHAEPARGVPDGFRNARQAELRAQSNRRNREERKGDERRPEPDADERQHDREHREARNDPQHVDEPERRGAQERDRCDHRSERYADRERRRERRSREREMIANVDEQIDHKKPLNWTFAGACRIDSLYDRARAIHFGRLRVRAGSANAAAARRPVPVL